jgi:hypothetical protein
MGILSKILGGGDMVGAIERIASEAITTDMESAEAKALWIKTLDPNGLMRRQLSQFACQAYGGYLIIMSSLALIHSVVGSPATLEAMSAITALFLPITTAWGTIVTASFGVNATNSIKNRD